MSRNFGVRDKREFIPAEWHGYTPTWVDLGILVGTMGFFGFLFLCFLRFLPIIPIAELQEETTEARVPERVGLRTGRDGDPHRDRPIDVGRSPEASD